MLTESDLRTLERLRLARLKEIIEPVTRAITLLDVNNVFHLHCQSPALVDELLQWDIGQAVQIIIGCEALQIWFADEIVWSHPETKDELCFISEHHDIEFTRDSDMGTAVLERSSVESIVQETIAPVIDETIDRVIDDYLNSAEIKALIRQRVEQRFPLSVNGNTNGKAETVAIVAEPEPKPAASTRKPAARKTVAKKKPAAKRTSTRAKKTAAETK